MTATVVTMWLLWLTPNNNNAVAVSGLASKAACEELAAKMGAGEAWNQRSYRCLPYEGYAVAVPGKEGER